MQATAQALTADGFTAGLWILPFGGSWNDPFFAPHQDWFVKNQADGKPFDTAWGGTALDMTHPGARAFVQGEIQQAVHDWGYHYLKLDGLSTGAGVRPQYVNDAWKEDHLGDGVFHDPAKTNLDAFRDGLRLIRTTAGPKTFILGCCAPQNMRSYAGVFGLVDAMRMGPDNGANWNGWMASPTYGSRNYHLNGRIWWSDPDPIYVRDSIPLESARCMASWNAIAGQMISLSDWLPSLPEQRLDIIRRCIPGHGVTARPIDLFTAAVPRQWLVTDPRPNRQRRDVLGLFNWSSNTDAVSLPLAGLGLPPADQYIAYDFWDRTLLKPFKETLNVSVPGAACRILAVRPLLARPFLISTSRHVSQGILDVSQERWDAPANTLAGTSAVVAGDAYELRVVAQAPATAWALVKAEVSAADAAAGVTLSCSASNGLVRVTIHSPVSREVAWTLCFAAGAKAAQSAGGSARAGDADATGMVLKAGAFRHYVEDFTRNDHELYQGAIANAAAWDFLKDNIPLLDCPDQDIETTYYFRWWTYRKHIKQTPDGFVVDEFLPNVSWAGKYNSISCAAGHHLYEGRWLRDPQYLDDYTAFWFRKGGEPRRYSFWAADSVWQRFCVTGDNREALRLLPDLIANYQAWEQSHRDANGLFWQIDDRDGMEVSIGGSGYRATINSYQFGDALAIARIAQLAGKADIAAAYQEKAAAIKTLVQQKLWDPQAQFFKVLPRGGDQPLADVRELHGYTPWYFNLPDARFAVAWKQVMDPQGFFAPFGLTTAEQRHPKFALAYAAHECQWNGPSWPYATSVTLTGLANLLNGPAQNVISARDYFTLLKIYATSQRLKLDDGRVVPWIDENLNPATGDWISRTRLKNWKNGTWDAGKGGEERGKDYNHSTFCDLVISGLIGLRPRADPTLEVNPLVPAAWDFFCLDRIPYHGRNLTILYDKTGNRYHKGAGLRVFADGKEIAAAARLARLTGTLP